MGRILLKNKNWSIISHFCSVTQRSWVPGVGMTSKHPQLIPENIGDYVISSWWLHQIKSQVYLVGKISEREDVEMNKKKLRPNVLLSLTFAVSVLSSNKSLSIWCVSRVFKYDTLVRNLFHIQGGKTVLDHHHELHASICLVLWLSGDTYEGWMTSVWSGQTYKTPLTSEVVRCPPPLLEAPLLALAVLRLVLLLAGAVGVDLAHLAGVAGDAASVPDTDRQHHHQH